MEAEKLVEKFRKELDSVLVCTVKTTDNNLLFENLIPYFET